MLHRPKQNLEINGKVAKLILFTFYKITTVFQKYPWKYAIDPLITLEIPLNFLIWDVWEPCDRWCSFPGMDAWQFLFCENRLSGGCVHVKSSIMAMLSFCSPSVQALHEDNHE